MTSYAETLNYEHAAPLPSLGNVNMNMNWASRISQWHAPSWTGFGSWQAMYVFLYMVKETPGQIKAQQWGRDGQQAPIYLFSKIPQHLSHCTTPPGQLLQEVTMLLTSSSAQPHCLAHCCPSSMGFIRLFGIKKHWGMGLGCWNKGL